MRDMRLGDVMATFIQPLQRLQQQLEPLYSSLLIGTPTTARFFEHNGKLRVSIEVRLPNDKSYTLIKDYHKWCGPQNSERERLKYLNQHVFAHVEQLGRWVLEEDGTSGAWEELTRKS